MIEEGFYAGMMESVHLMGRGDLMNGVRSLNKAELLGTMRCLLH
jgi:hypothetical protein